MPCFFFRNPPASKVDISPQVYPQPSFVRPEGPPNEYPYSGVYPQHPVQLVSRHDVRYLPPGAREHNPQFPPESIPRSPSSYHSSSPPYRKRDIPPSPQGAAYYSSAQGSASYYGHRRVPRDHADQYVEREKMKRPYEKPVHVDARYAFDYRSMAMESRPPEYMRLSREAESRRRKQEFVRKSDEGDEARKAIDRDHGHKKTFNDRSKYNISPRIQSDTFKDNDHEQSSTFYQRQNYNREEETREHRQVFLDKASIKYGDQRPIMSRRSPDPYYEQTMEDKDSYDFSASSMAQPAYKPEKSPYSEKQISPITSNHGSDESQEYIKASGISETQGNVYVGEQEIPIVTPSDQSIDVTQN